VSAELGLAEVVSGSVSTTTRAIRDRHGFYGSDQFGRLAIDGSTLDRRYGPLSLSSRWKRDPDSRCECVRPEFYFLVPFDLRRCPSHPLERDPDPDPWPMGADEKLRIERPIWSKLCAEFRIPLRYMYCRLGSIEETPAVRAVREFQEIGDPECCVLSGPTGVGKTFALVAGFREEAIWRFEGGVFWSMPLLARALLTDGSREVIEAAVETECLAIDDVGVGYIKDGGMVETSLEEILAEREAAKETTYLSTNLPLAAFEHHVGDRIADRLRGDWGRWYSLPGRSLRLKPRAEHS
jgi:hypothetical protein